MNVVTEVSQDRGSEYSPLKTPELNEEVLPIPVKFP